MTEPYPPPAHPPPAPPPTLLVQAAGRARVVEWAMYLYLAVAALDVVTTLWRVVLFGRLLDEGATRGTSLLDLPYSVRDETIADITGAATSLTTWVGRATLVSTVVLAVVYLRWQALSRALDPGAVRYGPAAAVWCWLVPVWSFFGPKMVVNDLWAATGPQHDRDPATRAVPGWVTVWWLTFVAGSVIANVAGRGVETVGGALNAEYAYLLASALLAVSGVLLIRLTRTITLRQAQRAAESRFLPG